MRHSLIGALTAGTLALVALMCPAPVHATLFGQVSTAYTLDRGAMDMGGFLSVFENSTLIFAQYRRGLFANGDLGLQGGFVDPEGGDIGLALGADLKFLLMKTGADVPFDLALDPRFGYFNLEGYSLASFGGSVVISRDYALAEGSIAPYGAVNMRVETASRDGNNTNQSPAAAQVQQNGDSDSDFEISGIAGVRWDVSELLDILGEVVFDRDIGLTIGLNFKL